MKLSILLTGFLSVTTMLAGQDSRTGPATSQPPGQESLQLPFSKFIGDNFLGDNIERWRKATQNCLSEFYDKPTTIEISDSARQALTTYYRELPVSGNTLTLFQKEPKVAALAVKSGMKAILTRALEDAVREQYKGILGFVLSTSSTIRLDQKHVQAALDDEECGVIPCDPKRCKPDCSQRALERLLQ